MSAVGAAGGTTPLALGPGHRSVRWADPLVALAVASLSMLLLAHGGLPLPGPGPVGVAPADALLTTLAAVPIAMWRRWPGAAVVLAAGSSSVLAIAGGLIWPPLGLAGATYLCARGGPDGSPRSTRTTAVAAVGSAGFFVVAAAATPVGIATHAVLACAAAWLAGERARLRRAQLRGLRDAARRAADEAERVRELAVAEERTRIARDLHDTTAHALNVIALRSGTARLRGDGERALSVLAEVEELARGTMTEIGDVVGSLRSPTEPVQPPPGLAAVQGLVELHRRAGHEVDLAVSGPPTALPAAVEQGAFRVIQESLTNAGRHGTGDTSLRIEHRPEALCVRVTNRAADPHSTHARAGHGLIGMRERADAIGGDLTVERATGRFSVQLRVPTGGAR